MTEDAMPFIWADIPGHASCVFIAISYYLTNIYWLRVAAVLRKLVETDDLVAVALHRVVGRDLAQRLQARNEEAAATQAA